MEVVLTPWALSKPRLWLSSQFWSSVHLNSISNINRARSWSWSQSQSLEKTLCIESLFECVVLRRSEDYLLDDCFKQHAQSVIH